MKKVNYLLSAIALAGFATMTSCSKDSDDTAPDACYPCHIAIDTKSETAWDITNAAGGEEFCGDELADAESATYVYTVVDTLYSDEGNIPLPPGEYGPGSANTDYEIHCEEHGEHDDHDH